MGQTLQSLLQSVNTSFLKVLPGFGGRRQAIYLLVSKVCKDSCNTQLELTVEWCLKALLSDIKSWRISSSICTLIGSRITKSYKYQLHIFTLPCKWKKTYTVPTHVLCPMANYFHRLLFLSRRTISQQTPGVKPVYCNLTSTFMDLYS